MATNRFFPVPASGSADPGHIPTKPFGIKRIAGLPPAAAENRASEKEFRPFRFIVPTLPTAESQALSATVGPVEQPPFDAKHPPQQDAAPPRNESPGTKNWPLLLSVIVLVVCAFTCVFWLATSELPEQGARPNERAPAVHLARQGSARPAAVGVDHHQEPVAPAAESMRAAPAATPERALIPGVGSGSTAQEISAPSRAANAKTLRWPSTSPRPTVPASATPKKESVLNSVLAPPPA